MRRNQVVHIITKQQKYILLMLLSSYGVVLVLGSLPVFRLCFSQVICGPQQCAGSMTQCFLRKEKSHWPLCPQISPFPGLGFFISLFNIHLQIPSFSLLIDLACLYPDLVKLFVGNKNCLQLCLSLQQELEYLQLFASTTWDSQPSTILSSSLGACFQYGNKNSTGESSPRRLVGRQH